jgi:hypothetical protein
MGLTLTTTIDDETFPDAYWRLEDYTWMRSSKQLSVRLLMWSTRAEASNPRKKKCETVLQLSKAETRNVKDGRVEDGLPVDVDRLVYRSVKSHPPGEFEADFRNAADVLEEGQ